jgi:hypothetical protein
MKATELIAQLQKLVEEHGDLPVVMENRSCTNFLEIEWIIASIANTDDEKSHFIIDY